MWPESYPTNLNGASVQSSKGEVEVDLAFGVGLAVGLVFAIELVNLALPVDLEFDFKFIHELGRLSPLLGGGSNDFFS
jgi:hypothetical protein